MSAFLLGMGDAGVMNVIYTTVPIIFGNKSLSAYGLCKDGFYLNRILTNVIFYKKGTIFGFRDKKNERCFKRSELQSVLESLLQFHSGFIWEL